MFVTVYFLVCHQSISLNHEARYWFLQSERCTVNFNSNKQKPLNKGRLCSCGLISQPHGTTNKVYLTAVA